jgi:hypothetical protein
VRADLLAGLRKKFCVGPREHPGRSIADVDLISGSARLLDQTFIAGRFEVVRDGRQILRVTADVENHEHRKTRSHANNFGMGAEWQGRGVCPVARDSWYEIGMRPARPAPVMEHNVCLGCTTLSVILMVSLTACRQSPREPVTLQYTYSWNEDRPTARALFEQFTEQTGIRVKNIPVPQDTRDYVDLAGKLLGDGSGVDLLNIDLIWSPILEPQLADLRPSLSAELPLIDQQLLPAYTVNGKIVAVPFNVPLGRLECRCYLGNGYA